jgi:hypothetical protein
MQVKAEVLDKDEVVIRYTKLGNDFDGDPIDDVVIRVRMYEDTPTLNISIETDADSEVVAEMKSARDIGLVFRDIPYSDTEDADEDGCTADCSCQCDTGECDCNEGDVEDDECECCGVTPCESDCDEFCDDEEEDDDDCECGHCSCYPDDRCCICDQDDIEW